uniref:leucine--tRNA ligase n=1 Tax=Candidatus Giovannonibacteria bacterium GW2011_GWF2_42_19 TaxID=1618659 RepID=A0A0G0ZIQ8_9BACT|nr:MAG: Leucine-tRNA ligase [Candidatus Giovannonibacteria bacterium GW2011_GWF2_42_19]
MSKSKGNVVNPDEYIKKFGADALRMYLMFIGPFVEGGDFRDAGIFGVTRFLERVKKLEKKLAGNSKHGLSEDSEKLFHQTIKKVTEDIESLRYNTAISQLMILLNKLEELAIIPLESFENFLKLLAPFAPFVTRAFGRKKSIHLQPWPKFDPKKIKESNFQLIVQVDGKVRASLLAPIGISQTEAQRLAKKQVNVLKYINDKNPRKVIFVPNKLINFVL